MTAKDGFDAVQIDPRSAYLDLPIPAADSLQQPVGPLAREVSGTENPASVTGFNGRGRKTPFDPASQRHVAAADDELADFTGRRCMTFVIDQRETVVSQRIANGYASVLTPACVGHEPLHHRRFRRGVDQLDVCLRRKPRAQRLDVAP